MPHFQVGDVVRVERDEQRFPARGTWSRYRARVGVVAVADNDGEVGVELTPYAHTRTWFLPHELVRVDAALLHAEG
jgi:hypothetical protein